MVKNNICETKIIIYNSKTKKSKSLEKGIKLEDYEIITTPDDANFVKKISKCKDDNYGGYKIRHLISPQVSIKKDERLKYYSSFKTHHGEIKHNKSNILSVVDRDEINITSDTVNEVTI